MVKCTETLQMDLALENSKSDTLGLLGLGEEGAHSPLHQAPADGALAQRGGALFAHHQVAAGDEDDIDLLVHAHFARPLLLQSPQLLLHWQI